MSTVFRRLADKTVAFAVNHIYISFAEPFGMPDSGIKKITLVSDAEYAKIA